MILEQLGQLYRCIIPIMPWFYFLTEEDGGNASPRWFSLHTYHHLLHTKSKKIHILDQNTNCLVTLDCAFYIIIGFEYQSQVRVNILLQAHHLYTKLKQLKRAFRKFSSESVGTNRLFCKIHRQFMS